MADEDKTTKTPEQPVTDSVGRARKRFPAPLKESRGRFPFPRSRKKDGTRGNEPTGFCVYNSSPKL
ncbi:hypothetical protein I6A95_000190 [Clostridioides difficile]